MMSQLVRYASVISFLERAGPGRILEVGSGSQGLEKERAREARPC